MKIEKLAPPQEKVETASLFQCASYSGIYNGMRFSIILTKMIELTQTRPTIILSYDHRLITYIAMLDKSNLEVSNQLFRGVKPAASFAWRL